MWMNCWICPVTLSGQPGSRNCWLTVLNLLRTSSQSCSTRSEGCRSSPRLRRNDGVHPPPPPPPSLPPSLPSSSSSSALTSHLPATSHPLILVFFPSAPSSLLAPLLFLISVFISCCLDTAP